MPFWLRTSFAKTSHWNGIKIFSCGPFLNFLTAFGGYTSSVNYWIINYFCLRSFLSCIQPLKYFSFKMGNCWGRKYNSPIVWLGLDLTEPTNSLFLLFVLTNMAWLWLCPIPNSMCNSSDCLIRLINRLCSIFQGLLFLWLGFPFTAYVMARVASALRWMGLDAKLLCIARY